MKFVVDIEYMGMKVSVEIFMVIIISLN